MERSESSRTTQGKPPIAAKPVINFKISLPKSENSLIQVRDCTDRERSSEIVSKRRCESLCQDIFFEEDFKGCLNDSINSSLLNHLNILNFGDYSSVEGDGNMPSTENDTFFDHNRDCHQEVESEYQGEHITDMMDSVTSLDNVDVGDKMFSVEIDQFQEFNENIVGTSSASSEEHGKINSTAAVEELISESSNEFCKPQPHKENMTGNESVGYIGDEGHLGSDDAVWKVISSSIPDIISDHIIPKASIPVTNPDSNSSLPSPNSQIEASSHEENESNGAPVGEENQSAQREQSVDDDLEEEPDDLNSRRAILRGHSIRISHSVHRRGPSRLPSVVDSSNAPPPPSPPLPPPPLPLLRNIPSSPSPSPVLNRQLRNHLPKGWESRIDVHGRVFYIDHINRCTTWKKPEASYAVPRRSSVISEEDRRLMDRRYQSLRRSLRSGAANSHDHREDVQNHNSTQSTSSNHQAADEAQKYDEDGDPVLPGAIFLSRPDFFTLLQNNQPASEEYNRSPSLKHMVNKIRRDYSSFKELQHRKDLVVFVNHFAESNRALPNNWEVKMDKLNKPYYVDHNLKVTTYVDPRLPPLPSVHADVLRGPQGRSFLPTLQENTEGCIDYHDRLVSFVRQANILDILKSKYPAIMSSMSLKNKVNMIRSEGQQGVLKLKNDLELTMMLSIFEEDIMSYAVSGPSSIPESTFTSPKAHPQGHHRSSQKRKNLDMKLNEFYARLDDRGFSKANIKYRLIVRRDRILQDGYDKIMSLTKKDLQRSKLVIAFKGEDGLDYGGPSREFFFLLSRELFNPYYGLFAYSANDTYTVQVSPNSSQIENYLGWFRFSGRIIALALIHQYLLDVFFTRVFYKQLLHLKPCLSDLESLDLEFYRSLTWINEKATSEELESMCLTFSVTEEVEDDESESNCVDEGEFRSRKGLLGWFDELVKGKTYFENEAKRSKSNPRSQRLMAASALNINSASSEYNNLPQRRVSSYLEPGRNAESSSNPVLPPDPINNSLSASGFRSTECLSGIEMVSPSHLVPRIIERELKTNGKNLSVTEKNKKEYVDRMINWRVRRGTQRQMEALIFGFNEILEPKLLSRFDAHELELVIAGSLEIDIHDWRVNTNYRSGYSDNHQVITWFWNVVASYDNNQRLRLLQFVTGTSSIPVEGFSALRGSTGPKKFCIEKWGKVTDLPRAHTCFNRLDLPPYTSYGILLEKLTIAVEETSTFGIE